MVHICMHAHSHRFIYYTHTHTHSGDNSIAIDLNPLVWPQCAHNEQLNNHIHHV